MTLLIQQNQKATSPEANGIFSDNWIPAELERGYSLTRNVFNTYETSLSSNISIAAGKAEQLIDALYEELAMDISVSFMRVETEKIFHVLLLLKKEDFLSAKIQTARILAEQIADRSGDCEVRFAFAIESENMMSNDFRFAGYRLMYSR